MTALPTIAAAATAGLTFVGALGYRVLWRSLKGETRIPAGFGAFLAPVLVVSALFAGAPANTLGAFVIVTFACALYWVDDFSGLGVRLRLVVQFVVGTTITGLVLGPVYAHQPALLTGLCLVGGALNTVLTNVTNFYDGADLNLGLLIGLTAAAVLAFASADQSLAAAGLFLLAFIGPFALLNCRPRTLELGDSGAFAFACFLTILAASYARPAPTLGLLALAPLALPCLDVAFVLALRVARKEDLLSRNFHHLYQRLQRRSAGRLYLTPQVINLVVVAGADIVLQRAGLPKAAADIAAMVGATTATCFAMRYALLRPAWIA